MRQAANGVGAVDKLTRALDDWQVLVVGMSSTVLDTCQLVGLGTEELPFRSCCSSNSSDTSGRVRWAYLLQLA
jgi:hypothetical protein